MNSLILDSLITESPMCCFSWPMSDINIIDQEFLKIPDHNFQGDDKRKFIINYNWGVATKSMIQIHSSFQKNKHVLIDKLLETGLWYMPHHRDKLYENLKLSICAQHDQPGFKMDWHLDQRLIFANGILNISENESNTDFSTTKSPDNIYYTLPGTAGTGIFWLSTEKNYHRVRPFTRNRRCITFTLSFYPL